MVMTYASRPSWNQQNSIVQYLLIRNIILESVRQRQVAEGGMIDMQRPHCCPDPRRDPSTPFLVAYMCSGLAAKTSP
jgi:hypothetical protein